MAQSVFILGACASGYALADERPRADRGGVAKRRFESDGNLIETTYDIRGKAISRIIRPHVDPPWGLLGILNSRCKHELF
ncbi:MAG: hypothetical protein JXA20_08380 [Spirochaetes bacterium]|nr:hypothetical protein [Spirochaetota bacterium]